MADPGLNSVGWFPLLITANHLDSAILTSYNRVHIAAAYMSDVTVILSRIASGAPGAADALIPLVYDELRKLAAARLAHETPGQTLQPTALVHEAFMRLVDGAESQQWDSRGHFFAATAEAMRRILVERARRKAAIKYGGKFTRWELNESIVADDSRSAELLALDEALTRLEHHDRQAAQIVKLRYFAGLGHEEAAAALNISRRAADRLWALAKAWLYTQLAEK